jgi:hypothetical protein
VRCAQLLFALFLLYKSASPVFAQDDKPVIPARPVVINGSQHPELIPDSLAYRIVFNQLIVYIGDPETEKRSFAKLGLAPDDTETVYRILKGYKENFEALTKTYNDALLEAKKNNRQPDPADQENYRSQRSDLVRSTRKDLEGSLSAAGVARFREYVQAQKKTMNVTLDD